MTEIPKAPAHVGQIIKWDPVLADITLNQPERRGFTVNDQLERLLEASDLTSEFGVMHQVLALCALPRTNPGEERQYRRDNGWWTLYMTATGVPGLPYGSYPRLLLAWVSTEAVRTRSPVLDLGDSLAGFMRTLGVHSTGAGPRGIRTHLRDQMYRLFNTSIRLDTRQRIGDTQGLASVSSQVASHTEFWWELDETGQEQIDQGKIRLAHDLFENLLAHPVPVDLRTLRALRRSSLRDRPLPVAQLCGLQASQPQNGDLAAAVPAVRRPPTADLRPAGDTELPEKRPPRTPEDPGGLARAPRQSHPRPRRRPRQRKGGRAPDLPFADENPAAIPRAMTLSLLLWSALGEPESFAQPNYLEVTTCSLTTCNGMPFHRRKGAQWYAVSSTERGVMVCRFIDAMRPAPRPLWKSS